MIHHTLIDVMICIRIRLEFNGKLNLHKNCGCTIILKTGDTEEHLITNWMETGAGFCLTTEIVNEHCRSEEKCEVSRYCVMSSFYRMNPRIKTTRKVVSGGNNDKWINTRGKYTKQFMIILGKLTEEQIMTNAEGLRSFGPIPPWFDPTLLPKITHTQIVWWDECHIEKQGGKLGNRNLCFQFKRDKNGKLCNDGEYNDLPTRTTYKFPEQVRFCFGDATRLLLGEDVLSGVRCEMLDYTSRMIVTHEVYEKYLKEEM